MPTLRKVYLYEETHLPQKGWLQGCMICGVITSHLLLFKTKFDEKKEMKYEIYTYICPNCKKNLKNKEALNKYTITSNKMLNDNDESLSS
jgi:hypothetical protein